MGRSEKEADGSQGEFKLGTARSKWLRLCMKWQRTYLMDKNHPEYGSWLDADFEGEYFRVGCIPCNAAGQRCPFAAYEITTPAALQVVNFTKHANGRRHIAAMQTYLKTKFGCFGHAAAAHVDAPSTEAYKDLVNAIKDGVATCGTTKKAKMTWTLAEAIKSIDQGRVAKCHSMALFRDESKSRLAIRFRIVSPTLDVHQGFLGQEADFGTGSLTVTKATSTIMRRFSSRFSGAPGKPRRQSFIKKKVLKNMRRAIRVVTIDSAADEVLSVEMMRSASLAGMRQRLTPNLQFLNRDKAHGSRRLISRGWGADKYLRDVVFMLARGSGSMARIIQNSPAIREKYMEFCKTSVRCVLEVVKNMRAAKHRYETMQKPLGRTVLYIVATVKIAAWCAQTRADSYGSKSKAWLQWINEERCIQGAMLADASDQIMMLTRLLDDETVDPAIVNREISASLCTLESLFGEDKRCLEVFGYTKTMLSTLRRPIVWHVGNRIHSLGSNFDISEEVIQRCLQRMRCWLTLMKATCAAEFPSFEIMQALSIFDLKGGRLDYASPHVRSCVMQIAKVIKKDPDEFLAQFQDLHPRAVAIALSMKGDANKQAWKSIFDKTQSHQVTSKNHPIDVVLEGLILYFVFGISSSGVEQFFAKADWGFGVGTRRQAASYAETEEYCLKVMFDLPHHDEAEVIRLAQKVWSCCYGPERDCSSAPPRISMGAPREPCKDKPVLGEGMVAHTETDFIKKRRRAAEASSASSSKGYANLIGIGEAEVGQPGWSDAHTKELDFQKTKLRARKAQAFAEKVIDADGDATLKDAARSEHQGRVKKQRARERKNARDALALTGSTGIEVLAKIQEGAEPRYHVEERLASPQLLEAMDQLSFKRVDAICEANVFVVDVPGKGGQRVAIATALCGGYHVSPEFITSKGIRGVASKLRCMARIPRVIYISEAVSARNKNFVDLLQNVLANCETNNVALVLDKGWDALTDLKAKYVNNKSKLVALVRSIEIKHPVCADMRRAMTLEKFVDVMTVVDTTVRGM